MTIHHKPFTQGPYHGYRPHRQLKDAYQFFASYNHDNRQNRRLIMLIL